MSHINSRTQENSNGHNYIASDHHMGARFVPFVFRQWAQPTETWHKSKLHGPRYLQTLHTNYYGLYKTLRPMTFISSPLQNPPFPVATFNFCQICKRVILLEQNYNNGGTHQRNLFTVQMILRVFMYHFKLCSLTFEVAEV